jgi:hypothetical protein
MCHPKPTLTVGPYFGRGAGPQSWRRPGSAARRPRLQRATQAAGKGMQRRKRWRRWRRATTRDRARTGWPSSAARRVGPLPVLQHQLVMPKASLLVAMPTPLTVFEWCVVSLADAVCRSLPPTCPFARLQAPGLCGPPAMSLALALALAPRGLLARARARAVSLPSAPTSHTRPSARVPSPPARRPAFLPACLP